MRIISHTEPKNSTSFSMIVRQMHSILVAILFLISMIWISFGTAHAVVVGTPGSIKWHPGHYYAIMSSGKNNPDYLQQVYSELKSTPALRGMQVRYSWAELEKSYGVYDFTSIEKRLSELAVRNKRLIILLELKAWDPDTAFVPELRDSDQLTREDIRF